MFSNAMEDWLGVVTIITILSGWGNYIVIKPLKEMITQQGEDIKEVKKGMESFKRDVREDFDHLEEKVQGAMSDIQDDIHRLRERVAVNEHEISTMRDRYD